ncbi:glycosyltransferase family 4 protein [Exiguobacterium sp. SH3S1]|uniref:glycosyltransferase family 4 protein n=1 Tax=Exiguobacterium sp. SH3S1 TaxID=2510955 RepID=UPI0010390B25|nr:glycosyltransferase family 4 protein [Exiguobacterium sp. SH3S1]TCI58788.1 glycosyltransferase [Exiguobacterium sp. SH3S1]
MKDNQVDIIIMSDNNHNTVGGEQESTKIILQGLNDTKYHIGVIHPGIEFSNNLDKVEYFHLTNESRIKHLVKSPVEFFKYIFKTKSLIKSTRPKVIHTQAQVSFFIVAFLKKWNLIPREFTFIHTERGLYLKYNFLFKKLFVYFMNQLDLLVTTTEYNMNSWKIALKNQKLEKFLVIPNTAGGEFEEFDENLKKEKRTDGKFVVGFAGRYCDWKNWPLSVEIVEKLNERINEDLKVKMAVGCLDKASLTSTQEMFRYLEEMLKDRFEGKINIPITEMNDFYYDIDAFILTSNKNTESFGRTLVEAMSRKNVVFTTPAGGSEEVVPSSENVFSSVDEVVGKMTDLIENEELLVTAQSLGLRHVRQNYSLENNINLHRALYEEIIGGNSK